MKYIIQIKEDNSISRIGRVKPTLENVINKGKITGYTTKYDIPKDAEEIEQEVYNKLINTNDISYCKWINSELIHEPQEEKEARLKEKENSLKLANDLKEKQEIKELIINLQKYAKITLTTEGKELFDE